MSSRITWLLVLALLLCSFPGGPPAWSQPISKIAGLTHKLQKALVDLPGYSVFDYVTFRIADGRVMLVGSVLHPELKQEAEQAIRFIPGVTAVENAIEILPQSGQDDAIRKTVYDRIYRNPQLTWYAVQLVPPVHIIVKNGHVTLEGSVNNPSDRFIAETAVSDAVGLSATENHLLAKHDIGELSSLSVSMSLQ